MTIMADQAELTFDPPGPGHWMLDATHHGRRPITAMLRNTYIDVFQTGMAAMLGRYGVPLERVEGRLVHGCLYARPKPLGEPANGGSTPPKPVLWLVARIHPALRRARRTAEAAWRDRLWRDDVDRWFADERTVAIEANLALQDEDPSVLDDRQLADHFTATLDNFREQARRGFETHGGDIVPVGDFLAHCARWGIDQSASSELLAGASPASIETAELLAPVARGIASSGDAPATIDDVRALGPEIGDAVDGWLRLHGWRLLTSDDLDAPTLAELPELQHRVLMAAPAEPPRATPPDASRPRARVPEVDRARFDDLLAEARYGLRLRDDNVGIRWNWPAGLLRRACLEIGGRLVARGSLASRDHVFALEPQEALAALRGAAAPSQQEVDDRLEARARVLAARPPDTLGEPEPPPPLEVFPPALRRAAQAIMGLMGGMMGAAPGAPLSGAGVGTSPHRGRACVAPTVEDALATIAEGDVLVTSFTGPAWNSLLPLLGAIVVEEGGPMCHAAIVAREFGIPAVVGVDQASALIGNGELVEVDPVAGVVTRLGA